MKLVAIILSLALAATLVSADDKDRIGAYYNDVNCGSGVGHQLDEFQKSPIIFNPNQGALSARIDHKTFTIYKDKDCTKEPKTAYNGGCARYSGELIRCLKY